MSSFVIGNTPAEDRCYRKSLHRAKKYNLTERRKGLK
jgi:hypothetical protein